jgi:hypothetical protein
VHQLVTHLSTIQLVTHLSTIQRWEQQAGTVLDQ